MLKPQIITFTDVATPVVAIISPVVIVVGVSLAIAYFAIRRYWLFND